ncbi:MAG TPA: helix-turn-helix transcriptional regulator, partial [Bacteroidales bacterium]|nr:helix-turn-helix transcriptional regulator [Bacteroidales bacterium]
MEKRLHQLLKALNLSASQFADQIGVQRSSISHVLSGRNKPSMDFTEKILRHFPQVNLDWLIMGSGSMMKGGDLFTVAEPSVAAPPPQIPALEQRTSAPLPGSAMEKRSTGLFPSVSSAII